MTAPVDVLAVRAIQFAPCDGFGDAGRSATLLDDAGEVVGTGYGETDDEAVIEALTDFGMSWDDAFDFDARALIAHARRHDEPHADDDSRAEFPRGEFPPCANVGPLA